MLPKINKLKKASDFKKVFKGGRLINAKLLNFKFVINYLDFCRFGFLVGLKVSKKATVRNRVRRQLNEVSRTFLGQIKPGYDLVIIAKGQIINKNQKQIIKDFKDAIEKAKLWI